MKRSHKKIGELFIEKGLITDRQLDAALDEQKNSGEFLGRILLKNRLINEKDLLKTLSEQFDMPLLSLKNRYIDWRFVKEFSSAMILDHKCFPIAKDKYSVTVAITNPLDAWALKKAEEETRGLGLNLVLVCDDDMGEVIERYKQYIRSDTLDKF